MDKNLKSNDLKEQKIKVDKRDQKHSDKNDNKNAKVERPVKLPKNKHTFVVAGKQIP